MILIDVSYYDLTLCDEPEKPDWIRLCAVAITDSDVSLYGGKDNEDHHLIVQSINTGRPFGTHDAIEIFGFEKVGDCIHQIKLDLRNMKIAT